MNLFHRRRNELDEIRRSLFRLERLMWSPPTLEERGNPQPETPWKFYWSYSAWNARELEQKK